ncbi:beta-1,4-glucuronyltransferase 1 [Athalia rosae]|uniref:beta-1,4-glucuronyltransferase 1 n=1 Tax=Athalia rosae TaxID=37344 RepID=UPI000624FC61|nr:beta-1,4-glucuronyltransferase 1 [Athalia rosae]XP_012253251.1 beta-1,4-glucuronyltransferase 1 [Athalia rosae]XP_048507165.1 beta-1,4-glucuronyltransferase 1 [Athalia rosae]XP_048507167.1 beta-1,4-glucuronyltransferase 1 [Athalia rosae]XP_048507168.1 beta-1,4-glucuronyltransferase 1 [Athalia rosae]XP_048507169.1 beta-1,4-glucuronyltransferase 1 [Athalia rosae]
MTMIGIARRNWALRLSVVLNVCVLLYVCVHFGSSGPWIEEQPANWVSPLGEAFKGTELTPNVSLTEGSKVGSTKETRIATTKETVNEKTTKENKSGVGDGGKNGNTNTTQKQEAIGTSSGLMTLEEAIPCNDKSTAPKTAQRGEYWVLYNYIPMSTQVKCWESVTYTTHADYTFLDNLIPLIERWQAPVSIALYAPGTDFQPTIDAIKWLRTCGSPLISQLVTFHVFFSNKHIPKSVPSSEKLASEGWNCSLHAPWTNLTISKMYKSEKKLLYPVNVGRNIAREWAPTHYVLPSDIELYPSPELAPKFLEMIRRRDQQPLYKPNPKVFPLSLFEVSADSQVPTNKTQLIRMLKAGTAIPFHKKVCAGCHNVPRSKEWQEARETEGLHVFHVGKRTGAFVHWEPIFIGTNNDPLYDERLSWEGKSDKMTQGYTLCVLDYDFLILDNAFMVHKPGIKVYKKDAVREMLSGKTNALIKKIIVPELKVLYGTRKGCAV